MKQRVVVIGLGIFGMNLVKELCKSGVEVVAIDKSKETVQKARDCATKAIVADGTDQDVMNAIGVREDDIVMRDVGDHERTQGAFAAHTDRARGARR